LADVVTFLKSYPQSKFSDEASARLLFLCLQKAFATHSQGISNPEGRQITAVVSALLNSTATEPPLTTIEIGMGLEILAAARRCQEGAGVFSLPDVIPVGDEPVPVKSALASSSMKSSGSMTMGAEYKLNIEGTIVAPSTRFRFIIAGRGRSLLPGRGDPLNLQAHQTIEARAGNFLVSADLPGEYILLGQLTDLWTSSPVCPMGEGSIFRFRGKVSGYFQGITFNGDEQFPLSFVLLRKGGLTYLCGQGSITTSDGRTLQLPTGSFPVLDKHPVTSGTSETTQASAQLDKRKTGSQLLLAAKAGDLEGVRVALKDGADINVSNTSGETALFLAADQGQLDVVKFFLEKGALVNTKDSTYGATALCMAAQNGHAEIVKLLLANGAEVNDQLRDGRTALWQAANKGRTEVVRVLLENGANVQMKRTADAVTPLIIAAQDGHTDVVRLLLKNGSDVNAKTKGTGVTPLMLAAGDGHFDLVKLLIENGADVNSVATTNKVPALWMAAQNGHTDIVELLLQHGADLKAASADGLTVTDVAKTNHNDAIVKLLEKATTHQTTPVASLQDDSGRTQHRPGEIPVGVRNKFLSASAIDFNNLHRAPNAIVNNPGKEAPRRNILAAQSEDSNTLVVYVPEDRTVEVSLDTMPPTPNITWFNPRTSEFTPAVAVVTSTTAQFPTPRDGDWILWIRKPPIK